jgi:hypothetical protein
LSVFSTFNNNVNVSASLLLRLHFLRSFFITLLHTYLRGLIEGELNLIIYLVGFVLDWGIDTI